MTLRVDGSISCLRILANAIVYLKHPSVSAAFAVTVTYDGLTGEIAGDVRALAKFLEASEGVPLFDLEFNCHQFVKCVMTGKPATGAITFSFESVIEFDELKSSPNSRYV